VITEPAHRHIISGDGIHCGDCRVVIPQKYRIGAAKIVCSWQGLWFPGNVQEAVQCTQRK